MLQNLRYSSLAVCELTHTNITLYTDTPNTQTHTRQLTHFSLGCYFQVLHWDECGEKKMEEMSEKKELQEEGETVQASEEK